MRTTQYTAPVAMILLSAWLVSACSGNISAERAQQCADGLKAAQAELEEAKVRGFSGTVAWTKAAGLITGATVQQQFEKYPNCIDKVRRARYYIEQSQR
jgi:hypothetical protein